MSNDGANIQHPNPLCQEAGALFLLFRAHFSDFCVLLLLQTKLFQFVWMMVMGPGIVAASYRVTMPCLAGACGVDRRTALSYPYPPYSQHPSHPSHLTARTARPFLPHPCSPACLSDSIIIVSSRPTSRPAARRTATTGRTAMATAPASAVTPAAAVELATASAVASFVQARPLVRQGRSAASLATCWETGLRVAPVPNPG